jgi:WD40 repeat protein
MVFGLAFSPDDKKPFEWPAHASVVGSVVFSPDGRRLASSSFSFGWEGEPTGGEVKVWDAATGLEICTFGRETPGLDKVVFSPDGLRLASTGDDGTVRIWDAATGRMLLECSGIPLRCRPWRTARMADPWPPRVVIGANWFTRR